MEIIELLILRAPGIENRAPGIENIEFQSPEQQSGEAGAAVR